MRNCDDSSRPMRIAFFSIGNVGNHFVVDGEREDSLRCRWRTWGITSLSIGNKGKITFIFFCVLPKPAKYYILQIFRKSPGIKWQGMIGTLKIDLGDGRGWQGIFHPRGFSEDL